jgi:predicted small secreted protein
MKLLLPLLACAMFLGSCNTTIGLGRDLRILGEEMEKSSARRQQNRAAEPDPYHSPVY